MAHRSRRTISTAFVRSFLSSEVPYNRGALALGKTRSVLFPQESFGPAILNRCGWVSLNIWGSPRGQHGSSPQNSEKAPSFVFSLPLSKPCQSLRCGLPAAGRPPKFVYSSSTWRRLSRFVPNSIHGPAKTVAGCSAVATTLSRQGVLDPSRYPQKWFQVEELGGSDGTRTRGLLRDRRSNQLNYAPAYLNQQRTAENVRIRTRKSACGEVFPREAIRPKVALMEMPSGILPSGRPHHRNTCHPMLLNASKATGCGDDLTGLETWSLALLRCCERRCRGLRGGTGWLCCHRTRDGLLGWPSALWKLGLEVWTQAHALVI